METNTERTLQPATSYTEIAENGEPYLSASRCSACSAMYLGQRDDCGACTARGTMDPVTMGTTGKLYCYTIVYRSYPGIRVPFVSAIVDLDDGGTVKGNLLDIEPDPSKLQFGMPVKMVFRGAETAKEEGAGYIAHFFVPA
ncbi:MAG: OB-fold domain-containing protein [Pseudomonas sp.]|uniref:Zn-ribbon domain-containing OB-fold protein n=1 Tax=Pseudomonas sp. TaxID=306 RepID=UPI003982444E